MFFRVIGRVLKGFFRRIGGLLTGILRVISRHEATLGIIVVLALLVAGILLLLSVLNINIVLGQPQAVVVATATPTPKPTANPSPTVTKPAQPQVSLSNAPAATETFLQGQVYFDADKVWNSLNASLHTELQGQGEDQKYFTQALNDLKSKGRQYLGYQFVGSYKGADKQQICFYIIQYRENNENIELPYTFWLDNEGKIGKFQVSQ